MVGATGDVTDQPEKTTLKPSRWSFRQLKFAFLNEQPRSNVLARLNQVHGFCRRVQAEDVFIRFMNVFDSKYFLLADSLYAVS